MNNIVELPQDEKDEELLWEALSHIAQACDRFLSMKNAMGKTLLYMADSMMFYIENYLTEEDGCQLLPKPKKPKYIDELENEDA